MRNHLLTLLGIAGLTMGGQHNLGQPALNPTEATTNHTFTVLQL